MFCSGCGGALTPGLGLCPQCGRPAVPPVPPIPGLQYQLQEFSGKVRALSVVWFAWALLSLLFGIAGLAFANAFMSGRLGPWMHGPWAHGPMPPEWFGGAFLHFIWVFVLVRAW